MSHRDDGDDSPDVVMDEEDLGIDDIHHQTQGMFIPASLIKL